MNKILIANRGEIACRVIRTARRIGKQTVAIYSDIDDGALHTRMADEAVCVGPSPALQSYLSVPNVMSAVRATDSHAVHPGYGFLSENMHFAQECEAANVAFIGPPAHAIESMGDKLRSKQIAADAGVNTIPGFKGVIDSVQHAIAIAQDIGYPVMMKASGGGGGKGMRIAYNDDDVRTGFPLSKQEALNAFNDDRMLVEKYIVDGHHIEIQVLADDHGNVVAFPERECSVQRRNQKVLEESPSCLLTPTTRQNMQDQAIALSRAVDYRSAGTIEFICDDAQSFYFLEMNTRLQVEHPITEGVTGIDLVQEMIHVAENKPLSDGCLSRGPRIGYRGHAIEARVYAEDPVRNFLPSIGPLVRYQEPAANFTDAFYISQQQITATAATDTSIGISGVAVNETAPHGESPATVRVDSGVDEGSEISMFYDPMISKLITFADTRAAALASMAHALDSYVIQGVGHNVAFLRDVVTNSDFATGTYSTSFIPKHYPKGFHGVQLKSTEISYLAVLAAMLHYTRTQAHVITPLQQHPYMKPHKSNSSSSSGMIDPLVVVLGGSTGTPYTVTLQSPADGHAPTFAKVDSAADGAHEVRLDTFAWPIEGLLAHACMNGESSVLQYLGAHGEGYDVAFRGTYQHVIVRSLLEQQLSQHLLPPVAIDYGAALRCPMPGAVVSIAVSEGQTVQEGQPLAIVEAMKMQNVLKAVAQGKVKKILCKPKDILKVDQVMMEFEF